MKHRVSSIPQCTWARSCSTKFALCRLLALGIVLRQSLLAELMLPRKRIFPSIAPSRKFARSVTERPLGVQLSVRNCFIRGSVVRYVQLPPSAVDTDLLHDATRREGRGQ